MNMVKILTQLWSANDYNAYRDRHTQVVDLDHQTEKWRHQTQSRQPLIGSERIPAINQSSQQFQQIAHDVKLGKGVRICGFTNLYGCEIGDEVKIGTFVEIQKGVKIGNRCKISSHTFICEGVTLEDEVFIGHNVTFINDRYPRATNPTGALQTEADWECIPTLVKHGASIGSGSTLLCGITVGEFALVAAGSVVTKDVPPDAIVAGNPARIINRARTIESLPRKEIYTSTVP